MNTASCHSVLPDGGAGVVPEWLHLIPAGKFTGVDGRGPFQVKNAAALITASMAGGKLLLDENHATDATVGTASPAHAWIVELQSRADGIWGRVEWNETGRQLMANKSYRGISPVFTKGKDGEVVQLLRAALTNNPNLGDLHTLHSKETGVDLKELRAALGLAADADEAACLAAATSLHAARATYATSIAAIAAAAGAVATDPAALVTELQTARAAAGDVAVMAAKVVGLETQLQTMRAESAKSAAVAFVDGAITAGKPIAPLRDHYIARHVADAGNVEKELNAMVSINAGGMPMRHATGDADADALTTEEMAVCKKMGQDPNKFAANKKKMAAMQEAR